MSIRPSKIRISGEPVVKDSISSGVDLVTFSGDKLLGGPQAGILLGKKTIIEPIRCHPIHRALRIDKMTLAGIEATLKLYKDEHAFHQTIPIIRMLSLPFSTLKARARRLRQNLLKVVNNSYKIDLCSVVSRAGGGSLPMEDLKGIAVKIRSSTHSAQELVVYLRSWMPPIIARIENGGVLIDVRTLLRERKRSSALL